MSESPLLRSRARPLERAAAYLRLPDCPDEPAELIDEATGLRCPRSGREFHVEGGVLDLLGEGFEKTAAQKPLDTRVVSWAYDQVRPRLAWVFGLPPFEREVADVLERLDVQPGDVVLDVACGHGNFTVELARRVGSQGLVIGVDIAGAMLRRAAMHLHEEGLGNVLLVRGDAMELPIADNCLAKINCSGGLHGIPDLRLALAEFARVSGVGARLCGSGFATALRDRLAGLKRLARERFDMHFVHMAWLRHELERVGYADIGTEMPSTWIGYCWARFAASPEEVSSR